MKASILRASVLAATLLVSGCSANGVLLYNGIFTHTVEPLTFNPLPTKVKESDREALGRIQQFTYPLTSGISIRLGKNGLGDIAKEHGIETIYYADVEHWSALFGVWSSDVVHVYGR